MHLEWLYNPASLSFLFKGGTGDMRIDSDRGPVLYRILFIKVRGARMPKKLRIVAMAGF